MRKYVDDYETKIVEDEEGKQVKEAIYVGDYFELSVDRATLKKFKRNCLLLVTVIIALHVGAGFITNQGMNVFYVALPYVFVFLSLYFTVLGILRLPEKTQNLRRDEIGLSFDRMKSGSTFLLILLSASIAGEIIFMLFFLNGGVGREGLFLIIEVLTAVAAFVLIRLQKTIKVQKRDKK